jgi:lysyl-tRNA synthetase class 2
MTPWWRPDRFSKKIEFVKARARILAALRNYFWSAGFVEVDTPALQVSPGLEPHLHAFKTEYKLPHGGAKELYLCTSPEFACKKLLAAGMERIYQLAHVFRNNEGSSRHSPEFMMLEWYRAEAGYRELMDDSIALLRHAAQAAGAKKILRYKDRTCDPFKDAETLTMQEAFQRYTDIDLMATVDNAQKIGGQARRIGIQVSPDDSWDDIVLRILGEKIEPNLGVERPCFLTDYPISMAALARPKQTDPRLAERFELYVCGLELANAFVELTDAKVQRTRFEADMELKKKLYGESYPIDDDFIAMLEHGMPSAAGIALGVDRLVMLATHAEHINDVLWAPVAGTEE